MDFSKIEERFERIIRIYTKVAKAHGFTDEDIRWVVERSKQEYIRKPQKIIDLFHAFTEARFVLINKQKENEQRRESMS